MTNRTQTKELKQSIKNFEFKVDAPLSIEDSAHRDRWKLDVNDAFDSMRNLVERQRQKVHSKVFAEIASQDVPERDEISQLRTSDAQIAELMDVVKAHLASFAIGANEEVCESDVEDQVSELRNISHQLAACVLSQEEAVASWFADSFDPDA